MNETPNTADLINRLSLEEKAGLTSGADMWHTKPIERLGIRNLLLSDGPHGLRLQLQGGDHVGLGHSNPATCFPPAAGLACSWDPDLVAEIGGALGKEARREGVQVLLGPGVNIKRHPLCGRNFEYFSEDPLLSGVLGSSMVRGIQSQGVGASAKHFAVNNQETDRLRVSADVDDRALREIYLAAFERIVRESQPWTVMSAYNRINGVHAAENHWLLTEVLREEWGFDGVVVSDWGAVNSRIEAIAAGNELEMPGGADWTDKAVVDAVRDGRLDEELLDQAVARLLDLARKAHAHSDPVDVDFHQHNDLARRAASRSAVLLKNDHAILPLDPSSTNVAVIGEFAERPRFQGAGSSQVNPIRVDNALEELRSAYGSNAISYAQGYDTLDDSEGRRSDLEAEAVDLASGASTVLLFLGLPASAESEGFDRESFTLPANQLQLLRSVAAANDQLVVILANGGTVEMASWDALPAAILETWLTGQAGGSAIADLISGRANPSGKLAETIPIRIEDVPSHLNFPGAERHVRYGEGVFVGYRYYDTVGREVAYPFGFGLSYTSFDYDDLRIDQRGDTDITASFTLTNTGGRAGVEVAQLYVTAPGATYPASPVHELRAFSAVELQPGESKRVSFTLEARDVSYWSMTRNGWTVEPGLRHLQVAASSRDIRLVGDVYIDTKEPAPLASDATVAEWLAHPIGAPILREACERSGHPMMLMMIESEETLKLIGGLPLWKAEGFAPGEFKASELVSQLAASEGRPSAP